MKLTTTKEHTMTRTVYDILSADRIAWRFLTRSQMEQALVEAGTVGDTVLVGRARRALAARGWL
jgi:hypothetical protein